MSFGKIFPNNIRWVPRSFKKQVLFLFLNSKVNASAGQGIKTMAVLTDMENPIGYTIGNALEVAEALQCLHGEGPDDLTDIVCQLGR